MSDLDDLIEERDLYEADRDQLAQYIIQITDACGQGCETCRTAVCPGEAARRRAKEVLE